MREADIELVTNEQDQNGAQCREDQTSRMKSWIPRRCEHVCDGATNDRADDSEHGCPEDREVDVHDRFRDQAGNEAD